MALGVGRQCGVTRAEGRSPPELRRRQRCVSAHSPREKLRMRSLTVAHALLHSRIILLALNAGGKYNNNDIGL